MSEGQLELSNSGSEDDSDPEVFQTHVASQSQPYHGRAARPTSGTRPIASNSGDWSKYRPSGIVTYPPGRRLIMITTDSDQYLAVNILGATGGAFIRERVFMRLHVSKEDLPHFSMYLTEISDFAIGKALSDDTLFDLCQVRADDRGSLKFFISHSSAPVHDMSRASTPQLSNNANLTPPHINYAPLPRRRSGIGLNHWSVPSTSRRLQPEEGPFDFDKKVLMVTTDSKRYFAVDTLGAVDVACIRERIFTKLHIPDEEQSQFSIYRTEIGETAIGEALSAEDILAFCQGTDDKGSLKFFISQLPASAPQLQSASLPPLANFGTILPPILPPDSSGSPQPRQRLLSIPRGIGEYLSPGRNEQRQRSGDQANGTDEISDRTGLVATAPRASAGDRSSTVQHSTGVDTSTIHNQVGGIQPPSNPLHVVSNLSRSSLLADSRKRILSTRSAGTDWNQNDQNSILRPPSRRNRMTSTSARSMGDLRKYAAINRLGSPEVTASRPSSRVSHGYGLPLLSSNLSQSFPLADPPQMTPSARTADHQGGRKDQHPSPRTSSQRHRLNSASSNAQSITDLRKHAASAAPVSLHAVTYNNGDVPQRAGENSSLDLPKSAGTSCPPPPPLLGTTQSSISFTPSTPSVVSHCIEDDDRNNKTPAEPQGHNPSWTHRVFDEDNPFAGVPKPQTSQIPPRFESSSLHQLVRDPFPVTPIQPHRKLICDDRSSDDDSTQQHPELTTGMVSGPRAIPHGQATRRSQSTMPTKNPLAISLPSKSSSFPPGPFLPPNSLPSSSRLGHRIDSSSGRDQELAANASRKRSTKLWLQAASELTMDIDSEELTSTTPLPSISEPKLYKTLARLLEQEASDHFRRCQDMTLYHALQFYIARVRNLDNVASLVQKPRHRNQLMELSSKLGVDSSPHILKALEQDEEDILHLLQQVVASEADEKTVLQLKGGAAQQFMDMLRATLNKERFDSDGTFRHKARCLVLKLSQMSGLVPPGLFIDGIELISKRREFYGGFSDIFRASHNGKLLALKRVRVYDKDDDYKHAFQTLLREALVWADLRHPNVLPFLGMDSKAFPHYVPCIVLPWMRHGTMRSYIKDNVPLSQSIDGLLLGVAQGLAYLHSQKVVHGDLRGTNILINEDQHACLADFGLAGFADATLPTKSTKHHGSVRWMAPELHEPTRFGLQRFQRTFATDVYALAFVYLEMYTGQHPFNDIKSDIMVVHDVVYSAIRPRQPLGESGRAMSDGLWDIVQSCWDQRYRKRPTMVDVLARLEQINVGVL